MKTKKPNVILVMSDQHKARLMGCYGHHLIQTPNLDCLAKGGVIFDHAFTVNPICTPSRISLMTGRHPHTHGCHTLRQYLAEGDVHLPEYLKGHGYVSGLSGKNHYITQGRIPPSFDYVFNISHWGPFPGVPIEKEMRKFVYSPELKGQSGCLKCPFPKEYCTSHLVAERAIEFIDRYKDRPFFLWISFPDPHMPNIAPKPYSEIYSLQEIDLPPLESEEQWGKKPYRQQAKRLVQDYERIPESKIRQLISIYYGQVTFMDDEIGRVLSHLQELNLWEDTIIIYTSDHGDYLVEHGLFRKAQGLYDCLTRIPLIISWPGKINPQRISDTQTDISDIMPSILDYLQIPAPDGCQGKSVRPLLEGKIREHKKFVFAETGRSAIGGLDPDRWREQVRLYLERKITSGPNVFLSGGIQYMARTKKWKLVHDTFGAGELYNLSEDPWELNNLYHQAEMQEQVRTLERQLLNFLIETRDPSAGTKVSKEVAGAAL